MRYSLAAILFATACQSNGTPDLCNADAWDHLIGQPQEAAQEVPDPKRVIPPNTAITKDYRLERTNIDLDDEGIITRIWCG